MFKDEYSESFKHEELLNLAGNAMEASCLLAATLVGLVTCAVFYERSESLAAGSPDDSDSSSESLSVLLGIRPSN